MNTQDVLNELVILERVYDHTRSKIVFPTPSREDCVVFDDCNRKIQALRLARKAILSK